MKRLGIQTQGFVRSEADAATRIKQVVEQAQVAEEVGLDAFGASEQHFKFPTNTTGPLDVVMAAVAQATKKILLQPAAVIVPLHHPLNVAERWACIDVLSDGRVVFGVGRGNTPLTADAFDVPVPETEDRTIEGLQIIIKAWTGRQFSFKGNFFNAPELTVTPRPVQRPHPPIFWAATSPSSHEKAGRLGLGLMTGANAMTWDQVERRIDRYRDGLIEAEPLEDIDTPHEVLLLINGHCGDGVEAVESQVAEYVIGYVNRTVDMYEQMVLRTGRAVDFASAKAFKNDFEMIRTAAPAAFGSPDDCIRQLKEIDRRYGVDQVDIMIDGATHDDLLKCIRLLGEEVRPAVVDR